MLASPRFFVRLAAVVGGLVALPLGACGGADAEPASPPPPAVAAADAGGPTEACPSAGEGTLAIALKGAPAGAKVKVTIEGPSGKQDVEAPAEIPLPGGAYGVKGGLATAPDPIVRTVFTAAAVAGTTCVKDGARASVEIAYAAVPSSGRLWMIGTGVAGLASAKLGATSTQSPESFAASDGTTATAFDRDGGMWIAIGSTLRHFAAAQFAATGEKAADVTLDVPTGPAVDGAPRIGGLALDRAGNLWFSSTTEDRVHRVAAEDLHASGAVSKYLTFGGVVRPRTLAFDAAGNLWIADGGDRGIVEYKAGRLGTSPTAGPDIQIAPLPPSGNEAERILSPNGIAFDASGNLWASYADRLIRLTPADQANSDPTPAVQILLGSLLAETIAFDESGGLWGSESFDPPTLVRFSPDRLAASSADAIEPERIVTLEPGGFEMARQLALYPAPAGLPLASSLP